MFDCIDKNVINLLSHTNVSLEWDFPCRRNSRTCTSRRSRRCRAELSKSKENRIKQGTQLQSLISAHSQFLHGYGRRGLAQASEHGALALVLAVVGAGAVGADGDLSYGCTAS